MTLLQTVMEVAHSFHVEIAIFSLAMCVHMVIFGHYRIRPAGGKAAALRCKSGKTQGKLQSRPCHETDGSVQSTPLSGKASPQRECQPGRRPSPSTAQSIARSACMHAKLEATVQKDLNGACDLVDEMRSCGAKPNSATCATLLKGVQQGCRKAHVDRALSVVDALRLPMDELLLTSMLEACIRTNRTDLVRRILQQQACFVGSQVKNPHTFGVLIRAYSYLGNAPGAWSIWRDMRKRHVAPTSISIGCMVEALVSSGDPDAGYELIHEMLSEEQTKSQLNAVIYCSVLKGFCHQKRFDRVWDLYHELLAEKLQFSIVTYNALIDACARSGEMYRATPLLEAMAAQGIEPNLITYSTIIKGYCQQPRLDKAFELLEHMKASGNLRPDEITYNTLIDGCARHCLFDRGVALLEEMQAAGIPPTNFTLSVIVKLANRCKKLEQAFDLCDQVSKKYNFRLNAHVYANLVHACTNKGDMKRAFDVLRRMVGEGVRPDQRTITLLVRGCLAARDPEGAAGLLRAVLGLPGSWHAQLKGISAEAIQPPGGLPHAFIVEALDAMATSGSGPDSGRILSEQLRTDWRRCSAGSVGGRRRPQVEKNTL